MDITSVLPVDGAAGRMLTAAIREGNEGAWATVTDLSRAAGLNRMTGARAHTRLTEAGILTEDENGWWQLNRAYPYLDLLIDIVEQTTGPIPQATDQWGTSHASPPPRRPSVAPTALDAHLMRHQLNGLAASLVGLERPLQDVYHFTKNERARDLIHQLIAHRIGYAAGAAATGLEQALHDSNTHQSLAHQRPVSIEAWAQALRDVVDEAERTEAMTQWLIECILTGRTLRGYRHRLLGDIGDHLTYTSAPPPKNESTSAFKAKQETTRVEGMNRRLHQHRATLAETRGRIHQVGGYPAPEDIGALADQLLATRLRRLTHQLLATAHQMANYPGLEHVDVPPVPDRTLDHLDVQFLDDDARDNLDLRPSVGRVDPEGARMMWGRPSDDETS